MDRITKTLTIRLVDTDDWLSPALGSCGVQAISLGRVYPAHAGKHTQPVGEATFAPVPKGSSYSLIDICRPGAGPRIATVRINRETSYYSLRIEPDIKHERLMWDAVVTFIVP